MDTLTVQNADSQSSETQQLGSPSSRLPLFAAVGIAAAVAIGGSVWFVMRPSSAPPPNPSDMAPSPYSPFAHAVKAREGMPNP
jgi:hypothetical protein